MQMVLWAMRNCKPKSIGVKTVQCVSEVGNMFYANDVQDIISRDFQNPETAVQLCFYPEETNGEMSEVWHGQHWREYPLDMLTPAYESKAGKCFYVNEIAQLRDGKMVIPYIWITYQGKVHARCYEILKTALGFEVNSRSDIRLDAELLSRNYFDLVELYGGNAMPNPYHEQCDSEDLYTIWMPLWADDVSGARSKQYQKHVNIYMGNSNLPGKLVQQEYFVHFVSASQEATVPEILGAVGKLIEETHTDPVKCYDTRKHRPCRFRILTSNLQGDNPQQSKCSHVGHSGLHWCRICNVGGPAEVRESNNGYHSLYKMRPRIAHKSEDMLMSIKEQLRLASFGVDEPIKKLAKADGMKDKIAHHWIDLMLEKARELKVSQLTLTTNEVSSEVLGWLATQSKQPYNPILDMKYIEACRDTPVEILHTILLGIGKYAWHNLHTSWNSKQLETFAIRFRSTDINGLNYHNGLVGKHFKTIMQVTTFQLQDLATPGQLGLSRTVGELGALLWMAEIDNLEAYLSNLTILIDNVLDVFAVLDPSKILVKIKLHLLKHLPDHIRRFGPAVRFATEAFECFNRIFRASSVLSNHQAPSHDIARKKWCWWDTDSQVWARAGVGVSDVLQTSPILQHHLGWTPPEKFAPGSVGLIPVAETKAMQACTQNVWYPTIEVPAQTGDICPVGLWVVVRTQDEVLSRPNAKQSPEGVVTVEKYVVGAEKHHYFGMPILFRPVQETPTLFATKAQDVQFILNVQHDCGACGCTLTGSQGRRIEREISMLFETIVNHTDQAKFVINTHALHNAARIRAYLPQDLTACG
ncbi:hypothetical protein FA13DRAFT_1756382 [Coprinellus micaceus]|uniref:Uncharacterized protein n=1 Tax=Coprinellus micaceus TaxID=71717 RepID=A0A4Y7SWU5_COPMI|nr:hypothetical protein FA13DRAFT_1756382 [Coprinellus micaceus]